MAVGSWQVAVGRWQLAGGMWSNCLGAVKKAGIMCPHHLVVGGKKRDGEAAAAGAGGGVLSTFYILMEGKEVLITGKLIKIKLYGLFDLLLLLLHCLVK